MDFTLIKKDKHSNARLGEILTDHGKIKTPIFMPVGTAGTVKGVHQHEHILLSIFSHNLSVFFYSLITEHIFEILFFVKFNDDGIHKIFS